MGLGLDIDTDIPIDQDNISTRFQVSVAPDIGMTGQGEIVSKVNSLYSRFQVSGFSRQGQGEIVSKDDTLSTRFQVSGFSTQPQDKEKCFH